MFAEDQVAYLAGVLAGCMTQTGTVATVGGVEIPPVVRFVTGFESGARAQRPDVVTLHQYIPDFNDPDTGETVAQGFINQGADVVFGAGGNTGNGALLAAKEAGVMAIGVDVDQYLTYPEVERGAAHLRRQERGRGGRGRGARLRRWHARGWRAGLHPGQRRHRPGSVPRLGRSGSRRRARTPSRPLRPRSRLIRRSPARNERRRARAPVPTARPGVASGSATDR